MHDVPARCGGGRSGGSCSSSSIPAKELHMVIHRLGFTLPRAALQSFADEAKAVVGELVDFESFVQLVRFCHEQQGFQEHELAELSAAFNRFDRRGRGEMDT